MDEPFCCRCKEEFEVSKEPTSWQMGWLRELKKAPKKIQQKFHEWLEHEAGRYLCGNCFFDLTD